MSLFSRRAKWLNTIFPASVLPQTTDPDRVSDDVSLVQPYDGSGWGIPDLNDWAVRTAIQSAAPTGFVELRAVTPEQVFRLLHLDFTLLVDAGPAPSLKLVATVIDAEGSGDQVLVANVLLKSGSGINPGESLSFRNVVPIVGPGCTLRIEWFQNVSGTTFTFGHYGALVPVGTVFYV